MRGSDCPAPAAKFFAAISVRHVCPDIRSVCSMRSTPAGSAKLRDAFTTLSSFLSPCSAAGRLLLLAVRAVRCVHRAHQAHHLPGRCGCVLPSARLHWCGFVAPRACHAPCNGLCMWRSPACHRRVYHEQLLALLCQPPPISRPSRSPRRGSSQAGHARHAVGVLGDGPAPAAPLHAVCHGGAVAAPAAAAGPAAGGLHHDCRLPRARCAGNVLC